jgi:hypothetical protein
METFDELSLPMDLISFMAFDEVIFDKVIELTFKKIIKQYIGIFKELFNF